MPYLYLVFAIAAEVTGTSLLKATDGFSRLWPTVACLGSYALAFLGLALTVRTLEVSVVYALWSGLGTAAIVVIGAALLGEPVTVPKVVGIGLIVAGVVVLHLGADTR